MICITSTYLCKAQVRPDINSFSSAQRDTLDKLILEFITPDIVSMHCMMLSPIPTGGMIHSDFNFLPFHRTYLEKLEDFLTLKGHSEFVPLPKWDPSGATPLEFRNLDTSSCLSAACDAGTSTAVCTRASNWDPQISLPSYLGLPVQIGSQNDLCDWIMDPVAPSSENCCNSGLSRVIEGQLSNPVNSVYHNSVHYTMGNGANATNTDDAVMNNFRSPSAPIFWIWHGYVDDIWKTWQCHCSTLNPPTADLYCKDKAENRPAIGRDRGEEPNIDPGAMYTSDDIWVRNGNDGFITDVHENPQYDSAGSNVHVYVRVRNRGCGNYTSGATLHLYWAKASIGLGWPNPWDGSANVPGQPPMGDEFASQAILPIVAGGQRIIEFDWNNLPNPLSYPNDFDPNSPMQTIIDKHHFCLVARIEYADDTMAFPEGSNLGDNVRNNNNIVWKNITIVDENGGTNGFGGIVFTGNPVQIEQNFDIHFDPADVIGQPHSLTDEAEVRIALDDPLWNLWVAGGSHGTNIKVDNEKTKVILLTGPHASLENIHYHAGEQHQIGLMANFLSDQSTEQRIFDYDITQVRTTDGTSIGGERFHVIKPERLQKLVADAGNDVSITDEESTLLSAASVSEPAIYNWYDQNDSLIYSGTSFTVTPEITTRYKLELTAQSDGFRDYDSVTVKVKDCYLKNIYPNPVSNNVTIEYKTKNVTSAYLTVTRPYGNTSDNYILDLTQAQKTIDLSSLPSGDYNIILVCDGQSVDLKTISKL